MNRASSPNRADSCRKYVSLSTKEDLNQLKDASEAESELNQFFFANLFYASFKASYLFCLDITISEISVVSDYQIKQMIQYTSLSMFQVGYTVYFTNAYV